MQYHMLRPTQLYLEAAHRLEELMRMHDRINDMLQKAPPGKVRIINSNGRVQHYLRMSAKESNGKYISQSETKKLRTYLQKAYNEKVIAELGKEMEVLEEFVKVGGRWPEVIREVYSTYPAQSKGYIKPVDVTDEEYANAWLAMPYEGKKIPEGAPLFLTEKGEHVRSKSEINIANALYRNKIPYKYECPLKLKNGNIIHPDFTILDTMHRKIIYWEHRGMMDDREYARCAVLRIRKYQESRLYPGRNLIVTEEMSSAPLGTGEIQKIIEVFFSR